MLTFTIRVARKVTNVIVVFLQRVVNFLARVETKLINILNGTDYSIQTRSEVRLDELYYKSLHHITPLYPSLPSIGRGGKVTLVIPSLTSKGFYGGIATALIFASKLATKLDMPMRIVQTLEHGSAEGLDTFLKANQLAQEASDIDIIDVSMRKYNVYGYIDLHEDDVFIASAWWDAYLINKLPLSKKFVYLIQDYEPIFYPNSDMSALANETYSYSSFIPVCNTELMYEFMSKQSFEKIKNDGLWFEPAVSRASDGVAMKNMGKKRLFIYGRPNVARNLFYSALMAVSVAFKDDRLNPSEWEILMAGQDKIPSVDLGSGVKVVNLGKMEMSEYLAFAKTVDVAVSPMLAPHPNYPTLEFASLGSAVVTTRYETKKSLLHYSKNIDVREPIVEDMTQGIIKAALTSYEERIANLPQNNILDSWDKALDSTLTEIKSRLR